MADLTFSIEAEWTGTGREGEGTIYTGGTGGQSISYSAPSSMGGKGTGTSPEELLISAVTACYSGTLFAILKRSELPVTRIQIRSEGVVSDYPLKAKFSRLIVTPVIYGADASREQDYSQAALSARNRCFIGKTIIGNVSYEVGQTVLYNED